MISLLMSEKGTTWTMLVTYPNGIRCLLLSGENWRTVEPEEPGA